MLKFNVKVLLLAFLATTASLKPIEITNPHLMVPESVGDVRLFHDEHGFSVIKNRHVHFVQNCFVDKEIRNLSSDDLELFLGKKHIIEINGKKALMESISPERFEELIADVDSPEFHQLSKSDTQIIVERAAYSAYLKVSRMSDGQFCIRAYPRMLGGGVWGAVGGALVGKFVASVVCHGAIQIVALGVGAVTGPAGYYVAVTGLEGTLAVPIEGVSNAVALGTGTVGMLATGPV